MTVWGPDIVLRSFRTIQIGSVLIPLLGGLIWGVIAWHEQRAIATDHAVDAVTLVRQYSQRLFETEIIKHGAARSRAAGEPAEFLRSEAFHSFLAGLDARQPDNFGMVLISFEGRLVASSRNFPIDMAIGHRDYIDAIRGGSRIFVDRMRLQPGGEDAIIVASPFVTNDFRGIIVSSVATDTSRTFLRSVTTRAEEAASLMRDDGKLLVRHVPSEPIFLAADSQARQTSASANEGIYETRAVSDGITRIYAFSRLDTLPLIANFGVPLNQVFAATLRSALPVWLLMVAISAFTLVATALARRSMLAQRESDLQALRLVEAENLAHQRAELVREMNHRVKNNLALVTSLINMQARRGTFDVKALHMRVRALAEVHDLLYRSNHGEKIDLGELIARACDPATLLPEDRAIALDASLPKGILISADRASPIALAALELVTNAVKHAFAGRETGTIRVRLDASGKGCASLTIEDDGIGMQQEPARRSGTGLVTAFVQQAGGEMRREVNGGTKYLIRFEV